MRNSTATRGPGTILTPEQRALISREGRIARVLEAAQRQASGRFARIAAKPRPPNAGRTS
jgi:hypothetical protein